MNQREGQKWFVKAQDKGSLETMNMKSLLLETQFEQNEYQIACTN